MLRLPTGLPASPSCCPRKRKIRTRSKPISGPPHEFRNLSESLDEMVRDQEDLTRFADTGEAIASAIRGIVTTGTLGKLEKLPNWIGMVSALFMAKICGAQSGAQ